MLNSQPTYETATDQQVIANYEAGCALEVEYYDRGEQAPEIITSTLDAWMREGQLRGIL